MKYGHLGQEQRVATIGNGSYNRQKLPLARINRECRVRPGIGLGDQGHWTLLPSKGKLPLDLSFMKSLLNITPMLRIFRVQPRCLLVDGPS